VSENHRASDRVRALKGAKVVLNDSSTMDCMIRNLSEGGARLEFSDPVALPDQFELLITADNTLVPVRRAWTRGNAVGVAFTGPRRPVPPRKS
jgi:two-component system cell cycle response regulator